MAGTGFGLLFDGEVLKLDFDGDGDGDGDVGFFEKKENKLPCFKLPVATC